MPITSEHPEYTEHKDKWQLVRDAVKSKYHCYVIPPEYGTTRRVLARNANYIARAVYTNYTLGTRNAWVGLATSKPMDVELPAQLEYMRENATPDKKTLEQLRRYGLGEMSEASRIIMLTDYPAMPLGLSQEEQQQYNALPKIYTYISEDVINWDCGVYGSDYKLNFLVLREKITVRVDGFKHEEAFQYKVLELDENSHYFYRIYDAEGNVVFPEDRSKEYPTKNGKLWDYIPVDIASTEDNNWCMDESPLWPIAHINMGHVRNNASYEFNIDMHGRATLGIAADMTIDDWMRLTKNKPIEMGGMDAIFLGRQGSMSLCQLGPHQEAREAMQLKQDQIFAIGGNIITQQSSNAAVATTEINAGSKSSPLVNFVSNFEQALNNQLRNCAEIVGADPNAVKVSMDKDFVPKTADPQVMAQLLQQYSVGIIPASIIQEYDRKRDIVPGNITNEDLEAEIAQNTHKNPLLPVNQDNSLKEDDNNSQQNSDK